MADIQLVDVSMRDGNQSMWSATGLSTAQMLQIAPVVDRVGFRCLDFTSSTAMGMAVRTFKEDPWERIRLMRAAMPNTPLQLIGTGMRFFSFEPQAPDFMQLVYDRCVANGISRFVVLEPMLDIEAILATARQIRRAGGEEIIVAFTYTISEIHDDAFYAGLAARVAACPDIDRAYIKDPSGLLTPDRARTLIPALKANLGGKSLELHSHCTIGLAPLSYLTAAELGIAALQVGCGPLGNGSSLPNAQRVVANLRELGHSVQVDERALAKVANYLERLAEAEGLPAGTPQEFDASFLRHQVAGGVMTTTRRQLRELNLEHLFDAVMVESTRVRAELGYPIMVTPFPQMVCTQALYNVIGKERYDNVSDQVILYVLGKFGRPIRPVDQEIMDRILARPRAKELAAQPGPPSLSELRKRFSPDLSDDEFLLRAVMPEEEVNAMVAAGPARLGYNPDTRTLLKLLAGLKDRRGSVSHIVIEKPEFKLELRGGKGAAAALDGVTTEASGDVALAG